MKTIVYRKSNGVMLTTIGNADPNDLAMIALPDDEYRIPIGVVNGEIQFDPIWPERAQSQYMKRNASASISDEMALQMPGDWLAWQPDTKYEAKTILDHEGMLYRVQQGVTSQAHQAPDSTGMLAVYAPIQMPAPEGEVLPWIDGETGIQVGDRRVYGGVIYEAIQDPGANIWSPDQVPALWRSVVD